MMASCRHAGGGGKRRSSLKRASISFISKLGSSPGGFAPPEPPIAVARGAPTPRSALAAALTRGRLAGRVERRKTRRDVRRQRGMVTTAVLEEGAVVPGGAGAFTGPIAEHSEIVMRGRAAGGDGKGSQQGFAGLVQPARGLVRQCQICQRPWMATVQRGSRPEA